MTEPRGLTVCPSCGSDDVAIGRFHFICRSCPEMWPLTGGPQTRRAEQPEQSHPIDPPSKRTRVG